MKRVYRNWLVRMTVGFAAVTSLRLISTMLHMTTLERLYKPRDFRRTSRKNIDAKTLSELPRYCTNLLGQKMDPINLVLIGTENGVRRSFEKAGWNGAHPSTPIHVFLGFISSVFRRSYKQGPFMPLFAGIGLQDLAFQKTTGKNKFAERHHVRIWRTRYELPGNNRIWVAAATHEIGIKIVLLPPFIVHRMNPNLDYERDFIATSLLDNGCLLAEDQQLNPPISRSNPRQNPHRDPYYTDGKAKVIEVI